MNQMKRKVLILYTELAAYSVACLREFCQRYQDVEIHLVRWPINKEAPFTFSFSNLFIIYERNQFDSNGLKRLAKSINPDIILCSGWIDKDYVSVCREWESKIAVVLLMDNKWTGSWKQHILKWTSSFTIRKWFNLAWVTGNLQMEFALKLGFSEKNIKTGFYSADVQLFMQQYDEAIIEKKVNYPHRFIYVGRYYDFKGVKELWQAFINFKSKGDNDWELWCLGTGDIAPASNPFIKHFGFIQPEEMTNLMKQCGVFILPSRIEPWGVVVHEFSAAGFPLLLSDQVGAAESFLEDGKNGFLFKANDSNAIESVFKKISNCSDEELIKMGKVSNQKAKLITPQLWAETLFSLIEIRL